MRQATGHIGRNRQTHEAADRGGKTGDWRGRRCRGGGGRKQEEGRKETGGHAGSYVVEVNCGSPGLLYNGWTEGSKTILGAVVEFRCHDQMLYEGPPNHRATCLQNGTWSHPLPKCFGR